MVTDMFGTEVKDGDYIAYALVSGRSANQCVYRIIDTSGAPSVLVETIKRSYGDFAINKRSNIAMIEERGVKLEGFIPPKKKY
jgi:hypothetical protein